MNFFLLKRNSLYILAALLTFLNVFLLIFLLQGEGIMKTQLAFINRDTALYSEVKELEGKDLSFKDLSNFFVDVAEEKGAQYAFDVLREAQVPDGIDMHLLAHVVGDILFKQEGFEGIKACTHDFRNACSHTIVIGLFVEQGEGALEVISDACRQAPGGKGAYTMCFHGLGHGVLAYAEYEMPEAIEFCKKMGTAEYGNREYIECVGGTVMEMMAGVHDRTLWKEKSKKYFKDDDPLYPCTADFMPAEARHMCYSYITPHLFEAAGGNLANPLPEHFIKAFQYCDKVPADNPSDRYACYGALGKEFVVLARGRDIRAVDQMTKDQLSNVYGRCLLGEREERILPCIEHVVNSLYWGGENDRGGAVRFCGVVEDAEHQAVCVRNLIGSVSYYIDDTRYRDEFCKEIPQAYQQECYEKLLK